MAALQLVFVNVVVVAHVQRPPLLVQTDAGGTDWLVGDLGFNMLAARGQTYHFLYLHRSDQYPANVDDLQLVIGAVDNDHVPEVITDQGLELSELHASVLKGVRDHGGLVSTDDVDAVEARI